MEIPLTARQVAILNRLRGKDNVPASVFQTQRVSRATTFRDLDFLVQRGAIIRTGSTRSSLYRLNPEHPDALDAHFSTPPGDRTPAAYRLDWLDGYVPGKTFFLPEQSRADLRVQGTLSRPLTRNELEGFLLDLTYTSSRLEGSTLSFIDTEALVRFGESNDIKDKTSIQLVLSHKNAIGFVVDNLNDLKLNARTLLEIHALVSEGVIHDKQQRGALRNRAVVISGSAFRPLSVPAQIHDEFHKLTDKLQAIRDPHEAAFLTLTALPYLQPFEDANKRTARIALNIPLLQAGLVPFSFSHADKRSYLLGQNAFYETLNPKPLANMFCKSYLSGCEKYSELNVSGRPIKKMLPVAPDPADPRLLAPGIGIKTDLATEQGR